MAIDNKNVRRGIEVYIDGKEVKTNLKAIEAEARKLTREIKNMEIGSEEYMRTSKRLKEINVILQEHRNAIRGVTEEHKSLLERANDWLGKWGGMIATVSAGMAGLIMTYNKMKTALREREDTKADVKALTGLDDESIDWLEKQAIELSTTMTEAGVRIRQDSTEILEAFKLVGSAKPDLLQNKEALKQVTEEALVLAQASGMNLKNAVDAVTLSMNQYGAASSEASRYANVMAAGSKYGAAAVESVTTAVTKAGVAASTANVPIEQLVGAIEALAEKGIKDQVAGTGLKTFFLKLETQAKEVRPSVVGLQTALDNLAAKNLSAEQMIKMFGLEAYTVAQALISSAEKVKYYSDVVTGTATATEQAAEKSDTAAAKMAQLSNKMNELGQEIAQDLAPLMSKLVGWGTRSIQLIPQIIALFGKLQTTLIAITAVATAYAITVKGEIVLDKLKVFWNEKVIVSFQKLYAVMAKHPFAVLAIAAAGLIDVLRHLNRELTDAEKKERRLQEVESQAKSAIEEQRDELLGLLGIARDMNKSYDERMIALNKLKEIDRDYFKDLTLEEIQTEKVTQSVNRYINRLLLAEKIKALAAKKQTAQDEYDRISKEGAEHSFGEGVAAGFAKMIQGFNNATGLYFAGNWADKAMDSYVYKGVYQMRALKKEMGEIDNEINKVRQDMVAAEADIAANAPNPPSTTPTSGAKSKADDPVKKALEAVDLQYNQELAALKKKYMEGEIKTEEEYSQRLLALELNRVKAKMDVQGIDQKQQTEFLNRMMDLEINVRKKIADLVKKNDKGTIEEQMQALKSQYDATQQVLQSAYENGIIPTEERYKEYLKAIEENYNDSMKVLKEKKASEELEQIKSDFNKEKMQLVRIWKNRLITEEVYQQKLLELRKKYVQKKMDVENAAAKDIEKITKESSETEADELDAQFDELTKYADKMKSVVDEVADAFEQLGENLTNALFGDDQKKAWKDMGKDFLKDALSIVEKYILIKQAQIMADAIASSTSMAGTAKALLQAGIKMAGIKMAFGIAKGAISNFWEGGFTPNGAWNQPQGVVHSNEFVANRYATGNPQVMPVLQLLDAAQRSGSIANIRGRQIAQVAAAADRNSMAAAYDDRAMIAMMAKIDRTLKIATEAYKKPSPSYCYVEGPGGIENATNMKNRIVNNASR